jgi:signal peptidase I
MKNKVRRYSYADQKKHRHRLRWFILGIFVFFLVYTALTSVAFSVGVLENETMAPNLRAGDRFIFSSYNIYSLIPALSLEKGSLPFRRGNIVLVDMFGGEKPGFFRMALDSALRFFTAQRMSLADQSGRKPSEYLFVKRVIGLPGDEITMTNFVVRVKATGDAYSLTEFELTEQDYTPEIPQIPALWDSSLPFSGSMDTIVLGENECFVLSDDRSNTNDSRTWGPVSVTNITGKALFRYWPITRLGRP